MSSPLAIYGELLRERLTALGSSSSPVVARLRDGSARQVLLERWLDAADEVDVRALSQLDGPVLDVGCGPGRHLHAMARRGVFGLGVDISPAAVELACGAGALAIVASIFDELPGVGNWRGALLLDGNIGIGGQPARLLRRIHGLLAGDGRILVELTAPGTASIRTQARLETPLGSSDWFPWAEVSVTDIAAVAAEAGLVQASWWQDGGRWFALLKASPVVGRRGTA